VINVRTSALPVTCCETSLVSLTGYHANVHWWC